MYWVNALSKGRFDVGAADILVMNFRNLAIPVFRLLANRENWRQ
jgi:hypothetical protein